MKPKVHQPLKKKVAFQSFVIIFHALYTVKKATTKTVQIISKANWPALQTGRKINWSADPLRIVFI